MTTITRRGLAIGACAAALTIGTSRIPASASPSSGHQQLLEGGIPEHVAAAVIANIVIDTSYNSYAIVQDLRGLALWRVSGWQWDTIARYAQQNNRSVWDPEIQIEFLIHDLGRGENRDLLRTATLEDATVWFMYHYMPTRGRDFELRLDYANQQTRADVRESRLPTLRKGSRGAAVTTLQYMLTARGYSLSPDGSFGSVTDSKVRAFQRSRGLKVDGWVGSRTWGKALVTVSEGSRGPAVQALKAELEGEYYSMDDSSSFGSYEDEVVRRYQYRKGLKVDGRVGSISWGSLID